MSDSILTSEAVKTIFLECLFREGEDTTNHVEAVGLTLKVGFHPGRLDKNVPRIVALLKELPEPFMQSKGGGGSFLNMVEDKHGQHWGEHRNMQELVLLGVATGYIDFPLPREFWTSLPGGVPYLTVRDDKFPKEQ